MARRVIRDAGGVGGKQLVFPGPAVRTRPQDGRTLGSLYKGLRILEVLSDHGGNLGVTELSERLRMSKAGVYRLLFTLERTGFVQQDSETDKYGLGMRLWEIGQRVVAGLTLQQAKDVGGGLLSYVSDVDPALAKEIFDKVPGLREHLT